MTNFSIIPNQQTPACPVMKPGSEADFALMNKTFLLAFLDYARYQATAIGLAANQCSNNGERIMGRFFVHKDMKTGEWEVVINPSVTAYEGIRQNRIEYCLTWKGQKLIAERYGRIWVSYFDMEGKEITKKVEGFDAQIWQHEIDHLNGKEEIIVALNHHSDTILKIERNAKCPCNSGRKYKHCCQAINEDSPYVAYN